MLVFTAFGGHEISPSDPDRAIIEPGAAAVDGAVLDIGGGERKDAIVCIN